MGKHSLTYHFASMKPKPFRERGRSVAASVSSMGHPENATPKSSCGHSMVPTARAHAAVCRAHTASSVAAAPSTFPRVFAERVNSLVGLVLVTVETCSKLPVESGLGHDRTNSSLLLAHAC